MPSIWRQSFVLARMNHAKQPILMGHPVDHNPRSATSSSAVDESHNKKRAMPRVGLRSAIIVKSDDDHHHHKSPTTTTTIIIIKRDSQTVAAAPFPFSTIPMAPSLIAASSRSSWSTARNGHLWLAGRSITIFQQEHETRAMIQAIYFIPSLVTCGLKVRNEVP
jgi:hypothetical protein